MDQQKAFENRAILGGGKERPDEKRDDRRARCDQSVGGHFVFLPSPCVRSVANMEREDVVENYARLTSEKWPVKNDW